MRPLHNKHLHSLLCSDLTMELFGIKIDRFKEDQVIRHCQNTAVFATYFYDLIEFKGGDPNHVVLAAELHDIGKLKWKNRLFTVPYKMLTKEDWNQIYAHPADGIEILKNYNFNKNYESGNPSVCDIIYLHHECPDGKGYYRIKDIPVEAAILHIADIFNACIANRPYKGAMPVNVAAKQAIKYFTDYFGTELAAGIEQRLKRIYPLKDKPIDKNLFPAKNIALIEIRAIQKRNF